MLRLNSTILILVACLSVGYPAATQENSVTLHVSIQDGASRQGPNSESHLAEVVVWLRPLDAPPSERVPFVQSPTSRARIIQRNKRFQPHLTVVQVGSMVDFPNRDPFFHNVFSLFDGKRFDLGLYEAGSTRNVSFDRPGISYIFCNIHAEMSAVVVAIDTPYVGVSDRRGEIVIAHVPTGRYTLHVWYESALPSSLKALTREINVTADSSTLGILTIPAEMNVHAHKNKYGMDYEPPPPSGAGYDHP